MRRATLLLLAAVLFAAVSLPAAQAQQQEPPKEKKKPRKVWTEDDLAGLGGRINVVGTEAPPPAPAAQPAAGAPTPADALWKELDDLVEERETIKVQIDLNQQAVESLNRKLADETDPIVIDELLEGRVWQEDQLVQWEAELERVNARIAELEKLTAGRKRPPKPKPVATEKARPAEAGEEGEAPPAEEPPAEEPPVEEEPPAEEEPPPPPPLAS
jgi:hypothetical protein